MGLVDYASDDSSADEAPAASAPQGPQATKDKPRTFQKVVDRSNPGKIRVTLPDTQTSTRPPAGGDPADEPDRKRIKLGSSGGLRGINAFLPAPKRAGMSKPTASDAGPSSSSRPKGLAPGISLKTGSEPAFSRQPVTRSDEVDGFDAGSTYQETTDDTAAAPEKPQEEFKPVGKATRFMPLSVSRKPKPKAQKARPPPESTAPSGASQSASTTQTPSLAEATPKPKPSISLFSTALPDEPASIAADSTSGTYEPLLYSTTPPPDAAVQPSQPVSISSSNRDPQSLDTIASDLNLSASERRQLFGRAGAKKGASAMANASMPAAVNVVNFNADAEYEANEEIRAAGEQPEQAHRVVRTVNAAGKNSLRSLVNVVAGQGEALEDHFAKGRRNKGESGAKYGF